MTGITPPELPPEAEGWKWEEAQVHDLPGFHLVDKGGRVRGEASLSPDGMWASTVPGGIWSDAYSHPSDHITKIAYIGADGAACLARLLKLALISYRNRKARGWE